MGIHCGGSGARGPSLQISWMLRGIRRAPVAVHAVTERPPCVAQALFVAGGVQMLAAEVAMAALLGAFFQGAAGAHVPADAGVGILVFICVFVSGFAYSWGPSDGWCAPQSMQTCCSG